MKLEEEIKQAHFRDHRQRAFLDIMYTGNWLHSKQQAFFKPFGITGQQFNILRILRGQHPKRISGIEIKSRMLDKNSDVSRLIDRLLVKELIVKAPSAKDKRAADISISKDGLALLKAIDPHMETLDQVMSNLTREEAELLCDLLDRTRN
jgi:DNA-binding MarR family transcriptional regulator